MIRKIITVCMVLLLLLFPVEVRGAENLQSGDRVVIWSEAFGMALSSGAAGDFRAGVPVTMEEGILRGYSDREIWTVTENEGTWRFENNGKYLSLDETAWLLNLDGPHREWQIQDLGDGTCRIVNSEYERYLTWFSAREVYSVTSTEQEQSVLRIWVLPTILEETESTTNPTTEPLPTEPEKNLDTGEWNLYFGQLHAHTVDSDGVGTVAEAFAHASNVAGLDFFAVTDHSDSLDNDREGTLTVDGAAISAQWAAGKTAAKAATSEDFIGLYGFEMSWNQGQGHISTFNTPGWLSRDRDGYSQYKDGLENYYEALLEVPGSINQFNHPGVIYGDFKEFAWCSPEVDALVTLIEVGSGAGSEYQTAYDYYTKALDKGWHLAPTNNQNNHEGQFGDADTNRTVVLASERTEAGIYDALRNYRAYATEDSNLQIYYTLNGAVMGSELSRTKAGDVAEISVQIYDPTDAEWGTVEVITTSGAVAASAGAAECVTFSLPTAAKYYYIRITQPDGDIAVSAPIWIRQTDDLGISALKTKTELTRVGEEQTVLLTLYNNEASDLTVTGIELTDQDGNILGKISEETTVKRFETTEMSFPVCFEKDGTYTLKAEVSAIFEGATRVFTQNLEISVLPAIVTSEILIDGTHGTAVQYPEFEKLTADSQISLLVETDAITAEQLTDCRLLIIPAPKEAFADAFLETICNYVNRDGNLLLLGTAGGSGELNRLLDALGATMTLNSDTAQAELYTAVFSDSLWTEGIREGQTYAHVNGCTLNPGNGQWLVKSREGEVLLAVEGNVVLSGSDFLADRWLTVSDNPWALPYANRTVAENLLSITRTEPKVSPIAQVRAGEVGRIYLVEGLVTAGTHNVNTTFPDTIYLQDATGGIAAVGYSEHGLELGCRVNIIGCLENNGGNPELRILDMEIFEKKEPVTPESVENRLEHSTQGGKLLQLNGTVISAETEGDAVLWFVIEDEHGDRAVVWIGEEILSGSLGRNELGRKTVQVGNQVSAVGLCWLQNGETVLRIRDCDEILLLWDPPEETTAPTTQPATETEPAAPGNPPTGDDAFPVRAAIWMLLSATILIYLCRSRKQLT